MIPVPRKEWFEIEAGRPAAAQRRLDHVPGVAAVERLAGQRPAPARGALEQGSLVARVDEAGVGDVVAEIFAGAVMAGDAPDLAAFLMDDENGVAAGILEVAHAHSHSGCTDRRLEDDVSRWLSYA